MQCNNHFSHMNSTIQFIKLFSSYNLICPSNNSGNRVLLHNVWYILLTATAFSTLHSGSLSSDFLPPTFSPLLLLFFVVVQQVADSTAIFALLPLLYTNRPFITCLLRLISCHLPSHNLGSRYSEKLTICWTQHAFSCIYFSAQAVAFAWNAFFLPQVLHLINMYSAFKFSLKGYLLCEAFSHSSKQKT